MSYDLLFWRGRTRESPAEVISKLSARKTIEGMESLERAEVVRAFEDVFTGDVDVEPPTEGSGGAIHGWLFSVTLPEPLNYLWVTCNWKVVQHREVLEKLATVGYVRLRCNGYNPQLDEFEEYPQEP